MIEKAKRPAPSSSRRRWSTRSRIVVGLVISAFLSGCGSATGTPLGSGGPAATPTASTAPSPSRVPTPSPTLDPGAAAVTRFVALVTGKNFSYQATFSGQSRATVTILPISRGLLQVSGTDVLVRTTWTARSRTYVVEHRYVGGRAWLRFDLTLPWHELRFQPSDSMAAFAAVRTTADVTYLGPVTSGGRTLYKVSMRSAIVNPVMIPSGNLTEQVVTSPKLVLLVDANGQPVSGMATIDGRGRVSGQLQEIVIDLDLTFSGLGKPLTIAAP